MATSELDRPRRLRAVLGFVRRRFVPPPWRPMAVAALAALVVWRLWYLRTGGHWDFMTYYWAAVAHRAGLDPYQLPNLSQVAGHRIVLPYVYPPGVLYLLRPFTWLSLQGAIIAFVSLKAVALAGLVVLWRSCLGSRETLPLVVLVALAFSAAVFNDFFAGNVSTFEQLALWLGFWLLLRQRIVAFSLLVVLASTAKLTPLVFLLLVLLSAHPRRYPLFAAATATGLLSILASFGASSARMASYVAMIARLDERGPTNPALLPFLKDIHEHLVRQHAISPVVGPTTLYVVAALLMLGVTTFVMLRLRRRRGDGPEVMLGCVIGLVLLHAIALPRFKDYSYIALIPAVVFVGRRIRNALPLVILLACLTTRTTFARYALADFPLTDLVWRYWSFVIAVALWLAHLSHAWRVASEPPAQELLSPRPP